MSGRRTKVEPPTVASPGGPATTSPDQPVAARPGGSRGAAVVGVVGELMVTLGVLLGLFVVWQLWWTDVVAEREQAVLVESLDWVRTVPEPTVGPAEPDDPPGPPQNRGPAPALDEPEHATTFATLQVPRWGSDYLRTISQGTTKRDVLDVLGVGHYEGTAMPGQIGNFAVAGHRATYGKPFNRVEELQIGDPLVVQTETTWYVYRIVSTEVVTPRDVQVIAPTPNQPDVPPTVASMTMTTCHPLFSARERFIVHAELDYWTPVGDELPLELTGGA